MTEVKFSPLVDELVCLIGRRKAIALCRAGGGGQVYVPPRMNTRTRLVAMLGPADAAKLIERWPGQELQLPKLVAHDRAKRDAEIMQQAANGMTRAEIARRHELTTRQVANILKTRANA